MNPTLEMSDRFHRAQRSHGIFGAWYVTLLASFAVLLLLFSAQSVTAQGITASITGTVSDPSGAVIARATVTVRQIETNQTRIVQTSDAGTYTVPQLQPGNYEVKVEKGGFTALTQKGITLAIDQTAVINARLTIGQQEERIVVTSEAPVIQTEDTSVGQVIGAQDIQNSPLNGRLSVMGLIALSPGVQGVGAQDQLAKRGMTYATGTSKSSSYGDLGATFDGVVNKEVALQRTEPEVPSLDALSQFKVLTNGAPAEFLEPSQVIVVTASGSNRFHGELLEYNRSKGTAAKSYFNGSTARPAYERNEFGGNFAGPILIPHIYNGHDRSFFFVAYEGFRLNQSSSLSTQQPTALERTGVFTEFSQQIIDPSTGTAFSNQTIPSNRINPVSLQLLKMLYPTPTQSGTGTNTYELVPYNSVAKRFSLRLDHRLTDRDQLRGTVLLALYGPSPTTGADSLQGGYSADGERNIQFIGGWTHTFSPTLLLDTYASYFHLPIFRVTQNSNTKWESIIPGLSPQSFEGAPGISISNITAVSEAGGSKDLEYTTQFNTALTKVLPRHTIKVGFGWLFDNHWVGSAASPRHGQFTFNGQYSQGSLAGSSGAPWAFADFLLGLPQSTQQGTPGTLVQRNISNLWSAYIQDDWKVTSRLTVNAGIRYDLQWFEPGPYNQSSLWVPSLNKLVVFGSSYPSAAIPFYVNELQNANLITLSSNVNMSNNPWDYVGRQPTNFGPRLGLAYQVAPNTVLRAAAGIYTNLLPSFSLNQMFGNLPFVAAQTFTNSTTYTSAFTMNNPFSSAGTYGANPSVGGLAKVVNPYTVQYNMEVEHQFKHDIGVRVGYVGQDDVKANANSGGYSLNVPTLPIVGYTSQQLALHQPLSAVNIGMAPLYHTTMNALQAGAHKQYTGGLAFGVEYQWTRVIGTESMENPSAVNTRDSYGPVSSITPQVLQVSYSYSLPVGRGKWIGGNMSNGVDKFIGGWKLSGLVNYQSGQPFSVSYSASGTPVGQVSGRANMLPGAQLYPAKKTRTQWFNPKAFYAPPCYNSVMTGSPTVDCKTVYNAGVAAGVTTYATYGTSGYNMLRGPKFQDWDMSLQKNIKWMEHYNLQLRADAFNVFNHPNFGVPNSNISNSNAGTITSISSTPTYQQRTMEFAAKFNF